MKKETELSALKEIRDILKSGGISRQQSVSMRFIRNSDGIVIDKRLNLIWYPTLPKRMTWEEAAGYQPGKNSNRSSILLNAIRR